MYCKLGIEKNGACPQLMFTHNDESIVIKLIFKNPFVMDLNVHVKYGIR
jgi:hypothetical protein